MISEALGLKPLMGERKQKVLSTLIVSAGAFFGFEALSYILEIYQLRTFALVGLYVYLFHIFWLTFLFDLHYKKRGILASANVDARGFRMLWNALRVRTEHVFTWSYIRHYQNYLILPALLYWAITVLLFLNPFDAVMKQAIIIAGSFCMIVAYWYMKEMFSRRMEAHEWGIKILALVKIFTGFFVYSAIFGLTNYFNLGIWFVIPAVLSTTFLLIYQALFQHKLLTFHIHFQVLGISLLTTLAGIWVYNFWNTSYLTGGLVVLGFYNTFWGILHHHLEKNLTRKLIVEYLFMLAVVLSILFASHNFGARIG